MTNPKKNLVKKAGVRPNGQRISPELSTNQKGRLKMLSNKYKVLQIRHSMTIRQARLRQAQIEAELAGCYQALSEMGTSMIESLGLDPDDPAVMYVLDHETGRIDTKPRPPL